MHGTGLKLRQLRWVVKVSTQRLGATLGKCVLDVWEVERLGVSPRRSKRSEP